MTCRVPSDKFHSISTFYLILKIFIFFKNVNGRLLDLNSFNVDEDNVGN